MRTKTAIKNSQLRLLGITPQESIIYLTVLRALFIIGLIVLAVFATWGISFVLYVVAPGERVCVPDTAYIPKWIFSFSFLVLLGKKEEVGKPIWKFLLKISGERASH